VASSGRSRFKIAPSLRSPKLVRRSVSGARSASNDVGVTFRAVRHTPLTAMLLPSLASELTRLHWTRRRAPVGRLASWRQSYFFNDSGEHLATMFTRGSEDARALHGGVRRPESKLGAFFRRHVFEPAAKDFRADSAVIADLLQRSEESFEIDDALRRASGARCL
jgi:hypothetical protein